MWVAQMPGIHLETLKDLPAYSSNLKQNIVIVSDIRVCGSKAGRQGSDQLYPWEDIRAKIRASYLPVV